MSDFDWKAIVKGVAPTIATVLGGPLAGMAVKAIGDSLGIDEPTQEKIGAALKGATPDDLLKIKQADSDFAAKMKSLDIDLEKIHSDDRKSARDMEAATHSPVPGALATLITAGFFGILIGLMAGWLKTADTPELMILLGALAAAWGAVVNFYYGSSAGSEAKTALLARKA